MNLISKKKLIPLLMENGFVSSARNVCYEAYGKKVEAYIPVINMDQRRKLEALLEGMNVRVDKRYSPNRPIVAARVSYFKAWHWDE
jgi:hypothetical protein